MPKCCVDGCQNDGPLTCPKCNLRWCRACARTISSGGKTGHQCRFCDNLLEEDTTHKKEVERIREAITDMGGSVYVTDQGRKKQGSAGIPDLMAFVPICGNMRFIWIDAKVGDDSIRKSQHTFFEHCESAGIPWVAGNVDDVRQLVSEQKQLYEERVNE